MMVSFIANQAPLDYKILTIYAIVYSTVFEILRCTWETGRFFSINCNNKDHGDFRNYLCRLSHTLPL